MSDTDRLLGWPFRFVGRPVKITFTQANTITEVRHQCSEVPNGVIALFCAGAITREPGRPWTKDLAYLRSAAADPDAEVCFVVYREEALNVSPT